MTTAAVTIVPVTIQLERLYDQPPGDLFDAYRTVDQRVQWVPAPEELLTVESYDFTVGGGDRFSYRSREGRSLSGDIRYEAIIDNTSLVYVRRLADTARRPLAVSIVSWSFAPRSAGTELRYAEQTTSLVGSLPIESRKYWLSAMLDRLAVHVGSS